MCFKRKNPECVHTTGISVLCGRPCPATTIPNFRKQLLDGAVEVMPVFVGVGEKRHGLKIAEMVESVGAPEHIVHILRRLEISEILARFEEKHKQEAVHHNDALLGERGGRNIMRVNAAIFTVPFPVARKNRVAQKFNRLTHCVAQRLGDAKGVLMGILVKPVWKRRRAIWCKSRLGEKTCHRPECRSFATRVYLVQIEDEGTLLWPFFLICKQNRILAKYDYEPGRSFRREYLIGDEVLPCRLFRF